MLSFSKTTGVIALAGMICSMQANNLNQTTGVIFTLVGGQFVEKIPGVSTVNEKVSDVTGISSSDLGYAEFAAAGLAGATYSGKMNSNTAKTCVQAGAEGFAAHEVLKRLHNSETVNVWLPKEGTWADKVTWGLLTALIHSAVEFGKKAAKGEAN